MKQPLSEFPKLEAKDSWKVLEFIKENINNGKMEALKIKLILVRCGTGLARNIVEYSIMAPDHRLFDFLYENQWLVPARFFVESSNNQPLAEYAVERNNYYVVKRFIQAIMDASILMNMLFLASKNDDYSILRLITNHLPSEKLSFNSHSKYSLPENTRISTEIERVKKFHNKLFVFFSGSRLDSGSTIYGVSADCVKAIHEQSF